MSKFKTKNCLECQKEFTCRNTSEENKRLYCNRQCYYAHHIPWNKGTKGVCKPNSGSFIKGVRISPDTEFKKGRITLGSLSPSWKGGLKKHKTSGYVLAWTPEKFPNGQTKYVGEHRLVMEKHLKRKLSSNEIVHHKNGIKDDNRIENLEVTMRKTHRGKVICPYCSEEFSIK